MTPERVSGWPWYASWLIRLGFFAAWTFYMLIFALNLASGTWVIIAAMAGLLLGLCLVMIDLRLVAILWFAGSPTIFVFANNVLDGLPFATAERGIFFGLSLIVLLAFAFRKREGVPLDRVEQLVLVFLGITLVSMIWNMSLTPGVQIRQDIAFYIQGYFLPLLSYWLMRRLNWTEKWVVRYVWALALASIILGAQGVAQVYLRWSFFMPTWIEVINEGRATGSFSNATEYGIACLISLLFALLLQARSRDPMVWVFLYALAVAAAVGLFLCKTRAAWLACVVCLVLLFVFDRRQRPFLVIFGSLGFCALLAIIPFVIDSELFQRRILDPQPIYARMALFGSGLQMLLDHPVLGIGFGKTSFETMKVDYLISFLGVSYDAGQRTGPPHNEWLGVMAMTGIFGFVCFVAMHVAIWRKLKEARLDPERPAFQRLMSAYVLGLFASQIIISFFVDLGYLIYTTSATYAAVGIVVSRWGTDAEPVQSSEPRLARHQVPAQ